MGVRIRPLPKNNPKTEKRTRTMEAPNSLEEWEVVNASSGDEDLEAIATEAKKDLSSINVAENLSSTKVEKSTTHEDPSSSTDRYKKWDGKLWSKYLSPCQ